MTFFLMNTVVPQHEQILHIQFDCACRFLVDFTLITPFLYTISTHKAVILFASPKFYIIVFSMYSLIVFTFFFVSFDLIFLHIFLHKSINLFCTIFLIKDLLSKLT